MAKKKKTSKPNSSKKVTGENPNPVGRPKLPQDLRMLMRDKSEAYIRKFIYWCDAPIEDVMKVQNAPWKKTTMDQMICSAIIEGMNGNYKAFSAILDRILGKPKESIDIAAQINTNTKMVTALYQIDDNDLLMKTKEAMQVIEKRRQLDDGGQTHDTTGRTKDE